MYILVIDDSKSDRILTERELRRAFPDLEVATVGNPDGFDQALEAGQFDLVITDYQLRWSNGLEVLQRVKSRYPDCPVIMFTNTGSQEVAVAAMKQGLDDYLIKQPKYYPRLAPAVQMALKRQEDRQQRALSELRLRSLLNQLEIGVFRALPNGTLLEANPAFLRLLGTESLDAVEARPLSEALANAQGLELNQRREEQLQFQNAADENLWLRISKTLNDIYGQLVVDGIAEDMTRQKQSEALLKRYSHRLRVLQELDRSILRASSIPDIARTALMGEHELLPVQLLDITLFDLKRQQATVLAVRSSDSDVPYGLPEGETVGLNDWGQLEALHQNRAVVIENLAATAKTSVQQRLFDQGIRGWTSVPIVAEGRLIGAFSVGTTAPGALLDEDMAIIYELSNQLAIALEQSRLRTKLQGYADELEKLVRDRTQQLEEANRDLETYAYSISHDLREPLRSIQGFAQILEEDHGDRLNDAGKAWLDLIFQAAERMETLIQSLLAYNRLNRFNLNLQPLNLNFVVNDALEQLTLPIQESQAQITVEQPLLSVVGHYPSLVQVMTNLLTNAIKFVPPERQPQIRVWTEITERQMPERQTERAPASSTSKASAPTSEKQQWVRLWVEDNGIGIAIANQPLIFGVFERLHAEETYPGTGMGLAIVRRSIERMNGRVGVESEEGQGSRFWLELPAVSS